MSGLSTHVLDLTNGRPAAGVGIRAFSDNALVFEGATDDDGRCPAVIAEFPVAGAAYRLEFAVADYFRAAGTPLADPPFFDRVTIDFAVPPDAGHHHVPLLVSPFGYSTYRGS